MRCRLCRYVWGINGMYTVQVYVGNEMYCCVSIYGGLMRCRLCRYMSGNNEMQAV